MCNALYVFVYAPVLSTRLWTVPFSIHPSHVCYIYLSIYTLKSLKYTLSLWRWCYPTKIQCSPWCYRIYVWHEKASEPPCDYESEHLENNNERKMPKLYLAIRMAVIAFYHTRCCCCCFACSLAHSRSYFMHVCCRHWHACVHLCVRVNKWVISRRYISIYRSQSKCACYQRKPYWLHTICLSKFAYSC